MCGSEFYQLESTETIRNINENGMEKSAGNKNGPFIFQGMALGKRMLKIRYGNNNNNNKTVFSLNATQRKCLK